jgi:hypothetical protein
MEAGGGVSTIMLIKTRVDGRCAPPVFSFPRVTGPHNVKGEALGGD